MIKWSEKDGQWLVEKTVKRQRLFRRIPGEIGKDQETKAREMAVSILREFRLAAEVPLGSPGYVYAMSNPAFPGLLKIGMTTGNVERRCKELSTILPEPFVIEHAVTVRRTRAAERGVHSALAEHRIANREWFRVSVAEAVRVMNRVSEEWLS